MKKKNRIDEETLRKMEEITRRQGQLLSGIYDDFFGKKDTAVPSSDRTDSPEEALKSAQDALRQARDMFIETGNKPVQESAVQEQEAAKVQAAEEKEPETDPMEELDALIGLDDIKHDVKELTDFVKVQKMRKDRGMKSVPVSLHLVFTGNPGTGKTTVARILARLYKQIGVLSKGQLIEVDRSGLVAGYVGQTAIKTQDKIRQAQGGILFIDEAYSLAQRDDAFGQEAIDTILKAMEDKRDDFVVIVAGYTGPMEKFINSNPGLKSRFNKYIEFPDYSLDELEQIFYQNCDRYEYHVADELKPQIRSMLSVRRLTKLENFANAREVRNMFEEIITNQARRIAAMEDADLDTMTEITVEDLVDNTVSDTRADVLKKEASAAEPAGSEDGRLPGRLPEEDADSAE